MFPFSHKRKNRNGDKKTENEMLSRIKQDQGKIFLNTRRNSAIANMITEHTKTNWT